MANHFGPQTEAGKAASSRNALKHGLTSLHPVVTEIDRPEYEALRRRLLDSLQPTGCLQDLKFQRILNAAWNMQRCLKLESLVMETTGGIDPLAHPDAQKQAALFQRYYLRFEGSYRANLRELERIQRLQIPQDGHFAEHRPIGALHNIQDYQRVAKRNGSRPQPAQQSAEISQPPSNQQGAKQNPVRHEKIGRNEPCRCGSGKKYKRCCGSHESLSLHAA